jgi:7-carboxy-7-deazaguanine synthase
MSDNNTDTQSLLIAGVNNEPEIFYTIEGEGKYIGIPSVFMRLSMCNLTCKGFASKDSPHGCDSYVSWSVKNKLTFDEIVEIFLAEDFIYHLTKGAILKITGGEPLIQQKALIKFIKYFEDRFKFVPIIDFESNGTLMPDDFWKSVNATFTISPKLSNNGDPEEKRYIPNVLFKHADNNNSIFKFVVDSEETMREVLYYVNTFDIPAKDVYLMPCCGSRAEHIEKAEFVAEMAKTYHFNFSSRLHLIIWDKALRV